MKPSFNKDKYKDKYKDRYKDTKKTAPQRNAVQNKATNPINNDNGQIISGYFLNEKSYKELIIARVNNFLYIVLGVLITFCLICYYFVSCKEVQLNQISRTTLELNFENDELQNKVDSLQSYYNIDKAVSKTNILERAQKVVEINAIDTPKVNFNKNSENKSQSIIVGY